MSQAGRFAVSQIPPGMVVESIQGNTGGPVGPDGTSNIFVVGDGTTISIAGNPGTNTLTVSAIGGGDIQSVVTDSGTAMPIGGVLNLIAEPSSQHCGSSVLFSASTDTVLLNVTDGNNNTIIGQLSGNLTMSGNNNVALGVACAASLINGGNNIMVGNGAGSTLTTGDDNILIGNNAGTGISGGEANIIIGSNGGGSLQSGGNNIAIGNNAGVSLTNSNYNIAIGTSAGTSLQGNANQNIMIGGSAGASLSDVSNNTFIGANAGNSIASGISSIIIGSEAGTNYGSNESSNILLGSLGVTSESNVLRVGGGTGSSVGQLNKCFISGIDGIDVGSTANVVTEVADQLGTAVIVGALGVSVAPSANTITIFSSGDAYSTYVNVTASPYAVLTIDNYISVNTTTIPITINLPNFPYIGQSFVVKDRIGNAATNNITVTTAGGSVNIDGATTFVINTAYQSINLMGNGTSYEIF